jgi:hypothetical protein
VAAFGFRKAAPIHSPCDRRELRLRDVTSFAHTPEHQANSASQQPVIITGTATRQIVNRDDQVFKSERLMTPHADAASWVLVSSAAKAGYRLAVAYRG